AMMSRLWLPDTELIVPPQSDCGCGCGGAGGCGKRTMRPRLYRRKVRCCPCEGGSSTSSSNPWPVPPPVDLDYGGTILACTWNVSSLCPNIPEPHGDDPRQKFYVYDVAQLFNDVSF